MTGDEIYRWDGSSWEPFTSIPQGKGYFYHGDVVAADSIWLAGSSSSSPENYQIPKILHWNGSTWEEKQLSSTPTPTGALNTIVMVSDAEGWAASDDALYAFRCSGWSLYMPLDRYVMVAGRDLAMAGRSEGWLVGGWETMLRYESPNLPSCMYLPVAPVGGSVP